MHKVTPTLAALLLGFFGSKASHAQDIAPQADVAPKVVPNGEEEKVTFPTLLPSARIMTGFERETQRPAAAQGGFRRQETGYFLQQARLKLKGDLNEHVGINLSFDLSDGMDPALSSVDLDSPPYIRNAFIDVSFTRALQLRAGRFKRPFSRLELTSSGDLPIRGRGLASNLIAEDAQWGDRALGIAAYGRFKAPRLRWEVAVMDPAWTPDIRREGADAFARVTYDPWKWLSFGVGGGYKSVTLTERTIRTKAGSFDVQLEKKGLFAILEAQYAELPFEVDTPGSFAFVGVVSYDIALSDSIVLQPAVSGEYADANSVYTQTEAIRTVFGVNTLFYDQLRVMPQVELVRPVGTVSSFNPWVEKTSFFLLFSLEV